MHESLDAGACWLVGQAERGRAWKPEAQKLLVCRLQLATCHQGRRLDRHNRLQMLLAMQRTKAPVQEPRSPKRASSHRQLLSG